MTNHIQEAHLSALQTFNIIYMAAFRTVLGRYKAEAVYIEKKKVSASLNFMIERGRRGLVGLSIYINRC